MENNQLIKQQFGLNIALPQTTMQEILKEIPNAVKQELGNMTVSPLISFLNDNYKLSYEEITTNLRKTQGQIYTLGQVMREEQTTGSFNMKF